MTEKTIRLLPGLVTLLTLSLLFLKAFNVISIGWWAVFAPVWISALILVAIILIAIIIMIIAAVVD